MAAAANSKKATNMCTIYQNLTAVSADEDSKTAGNGFEPTKHKTPTAIHKNPTAMSIDGDSKKASMCTVYEVTWETFGRGKRDFFQGQKRDFPLMEDISNWLYDLVHFNTDDTSMVEKEWQIVHVTPGHLFIFLALCAKDLAKRIHYPFKAPDGGWSSRPLASARWIEHRHDDYWDFLAKRQQVQDQPAFSKTLMRIK